MPKSWADRAIMFCVIALVAWGIIGLPIYLGPSERIQYYDNAQTAPQSTATEPKGTAQAPFFVQVIPGHKTAAERTQEAEEREQKRDADRWLVRWTAALFAATVGLILATGVLGYFAWRQGRDTERALVSTERAFIFPEKFDLTLADGADPQRPFFFMVSWKNGGRTWTKRGRNYHSWIAVPPSDGPPSDFPDINPERAPPGQVFIGPGGTIIGQRLEIQHHFFAAAMNRTCKIFLWGWCEYDDVFPETRRHRTEYCVSLDPITNIPVGDAGEHRASFQFTHYHLHNGADDDCLKPVQT